MVAFGAQTKQQCAKQVGHDGRALSDDAFPGIISARVLLSSPATSFPRLACSLHATAKTSVLEAYRFSHKAKHSLAVAIPLSKVPVVFSPNCVHFAAKEDPIVAALAQCPLLQLVSPPDESCQ